MKVSQQEASVFPLCNIQAAYFVGEQGNLPLSTTAKWYREIGIGVCNLDSLQEALRRLVVRHPMLRAIILDDGTQSILDHVEAYEISFHDLAGLDDGSRSARRNSIRETLISLDLPVGRWPQFCVHASGDEDGIRLHIRLNLWMMDATSEQILMGELLELCESTEAQLSSVLGTFRQYVEATEASRSKPAVGSARAYWLNRLPTLPLGPELPLKSSIEGIVPPTFIHLAHRVEASEWRSFLANASRHRLMSNVAVVAAYTMTLAQWSKNKHFTITLLLSGRQSGGDEMSNVIGNFGTTILLEVDASVPSTFIEFATTIQKRLWADIRNVSVSGIEVGREINLARSTPLNLVAPFTFTTMQSGGVSDRADELLSQAAQYGTHLSVSQVCLDHQLMEEPQGHVTLSWDYVDGLFHDNVVNDMFVSYTRLIHALAAEADVWLDCIPAQLPDYQTQLIGRYNSTSAGSRECTLDQLIIEQIAKRGDHPAVIDGDTTLSYAELGKCVENIRCRMAHLNISPGRLVGVQMDKGWQQIAAVLAVTNSGGAYVPIDPDLPPLRQRQLISQADISVVLTTRELAAKLDIPSHIERVYVDSSDAVPSESLPESRHRPSDVAYVIFTSGSTGVPKGVVISHQGAVNTIIDVNQRLGVGSDDALLALSSLSFDLSVFDIFGVLGAGGTLVIPTAAELQSANAWANLINRHEITLWNSVPALFQLLVDCCTQDNTMLRSLRRVMLSGDWIPRLLPQHGKAIAPGASFLSLGGATEASIWSVIYEIENLDQSWATIPYGHPLANQELHVLDEALDHRPLWRSGELYIGGKGVAIGYLNDPTRTQERFIVHPVTGKRLYRTGDIARMRPDGNMEFLGREDHQIKLRGFRIELGEVESAIIDHSLVSTAVVKVVGADDASKRLAAFVVLKPGSQIDPAALRDILAGKLPRYMVPEIIQMLDVLPLTSNGKIDHKGLDALVDPGAAPPEQVDDTGDPQQADDGVSRILRTIWEDILGQRNVDSNTSFFSLGGTSFKVLQLVAKIRKEFGCRLGLVDISPTVSLKALGALIRQRCSLRPLDEPVLIALRHDHASTGPAVICFHPVGGSSHCYVPLASHIADGARIFGVQGARMPHGVATTIEAIAERYVSLILEAVPDGPYVLVGWSMGAAIAVEVARKMLKGGKHVAYVGLLDPYCATQTSNPIVPLEILFAFCEDLAGLAGKHFVRPTGEELDMLKHTQSDQVLVQLINDLTRQGILPPDAPIDELREVFAIFESNSRALLAYSPTDLDADMAVFFANTPNYASGHYLKQWHPSGKVVAERKCDANHFTLMQAPAIEWVADEFNEKLAALRPGKLHMPSPTDARVNVAA